MYKIKHRLLYFLSFLLLSIGAHSYILYKFFKDGILFTGPNDGIEQMVPIQMYIYQKWSSGTFFYATDFGLGGDFFTDLSYYFTTNILFIINVIIVKLLHIMHLVEPNHLMFWFQNAIVISIIKCALILAATNYYASYLKLNAISKWVFATGFAFSPLYFRFTVYWPFFSDVFILLPLLWASIERYFKTGKVGLFILIVTLSFINNFYFAYYQLLMGLLYFILRLYIRHPDDLMSRKQTIFTLSIGAILGLGSSLLFFFHGARSFLNNERVPFDTAIPFIEKFNQNTNIIYDNYLIVILIISIQAILTFKLYRNMYFKLFAILSILTIISAYIPYVDSIFNGFSAPQKRWHYLLAFSTSGLIACYVQHFFKIHLRTYLSTSSFVLSLVIISAIMYEKFVIWIPWLFIVWFIGGITLYIKQQHYRHPMRLVYGSSIIILSILVSSVFTHFQIFHSDHLKRANTFYVNASLYHTPLQQALVNKMTRQKAPEERIDWRVNEQDNTPMYQHFKGLSLYSSIFDQQLIDLYYNALMINIKEESVSRYQSTGGRANIASLMSIRYQMLKDYQGNLPQYFKQVDTSGQYRIYENQNVLPAVKVTDTYYDADQLNTAIDREHAMIDGVVLEEQGQPYPAPAPNLLKQTTLQYQNAQSVDQTHINVNQGYGGATLTLPKALRSKYKDFYLVIHVKRGLPDSNHVIDINGYHNNRLFNASKYRTGQYDLLYRTQPDQNGKIHIRLSPKGKYAFKLLGLYGEDYQTLHQSSKEKNYTYHESRSTINIGLKNHNKGMMVINIPYRHGMRATVDGQSVKPEKVNYFMTGIPVKQHAKNVEITYRPPYFYTMIIISVLSILIAFWFSKYSYKKNIKRKSEAD